MKESNDWLDKLLVNEEMYIEDNGFTEQVMHQLPAYQPRKVFSLEPLILIVTALLASGLAFVSLPDSMSLYQQLVTYVATQSIWSNFGILLLLSLVGCSVGGLLATLSDT